MHRCYLPPEIHELVCTDELDKTAGTHRWNKKAANQLEKLNNDCNRTVGLEGELHVCLRVDLLKDAAGSFGKADRLCTCMIRSWAEETNQLEHQCSPNTIGTWQWGICGLMGGAIYGCYDLMDRAFKSLNGQGIYHLVGGALWFNGWGSYDKAAVSLRNMAKKCWPSGENPFRSSHDHRFRSLWTPDLWTTTERVGPLPT